MCTIGKRILDCRKQLGMTQEELGSKIGEKKQTIYKYETDKITNIPLENIQKLADALHVTPGYLVGWDSPLTASEYLESIISAVPLIFALKNAAIAESLSPEPLVEYFLNPNNASDLLYLIQYSSLKMNTKIFVEHFFSRPIEIVLKQHYNKSLEDIIQSYSREEINIVRKLRSLPPDIVNAVKLLIGMNTEEESKQNEALSRGVG